MLQLYPVYLLWNRRKTLTGSPDPTRMRTVQINLACEWALKMTHWCKGSFIPSDFVTITVTSVTLMGSNFYLFDGHCGGQNGWRSHLVWQSLKMTSALLTELSPRTNLTKSGLSLQEKCWILEKTQCTITILTQMYVCTLEEFIVDTLWYRYEVIGNINWTSIYKNIWIYDNYS